jgi:hypothetical protein
MVDKIAAAAGISHCTCHRILSDDLNMSRVTQHSVPSVLIQDQCDDCMNICGDLIDGADKEETFLNRIITGKEIWCILYNPKCDIRPPGNCHHHQERRNCDMARQKAS